MTDQLPPAVQLIVNTFAIITATVYGGAAVIALIDILAPNCLDYIKKTITRGDELRRDVVEVGTTVFIIVLEVLIVRLLLEEHYTTPVVLVVAMTAIIIYVFLRISWGKWLASLRSRDRIEGSWGSLITGMDGAQSVSTFNILRSENGIVVQGVSFNVVQTAPSLTCQLAVEDKWWSSHAAYSYSKLLFKFESNRLGSGLCIYEFDSLRADGPPRSYKGSFYEQLSGNHFTVTGRRIDGPLILQDDESVKREAFETFRLLKS